MTKQTEALKLALKALENHCGNYKLDDEGVKRFVAACNALKEELAQPEQAPVAWGCNRYIEDDNGFQIGTDEPELAWGKSVPDDNGWWPLYTTPLPRPWVGLTDEDWEPLYDKFAKHQEYGAFVSGWDNFARAIEAKLKEKNT